MLTRALHLSESSSQARGMPAPPEGSSSPCRPRSDPASESDRSISLDLVTALDHEDLDGDPSVPPDNVHNDDHPREDLPTTVDDHDIPDDAALVLPRRDDPHEKIPHDAEISEEPRPAVVTEVHPRPDKSTPKRDDAEQRRRWTLRWNGPPRVRYEWPSASATYPRAMSRSPSIIQFPRSLDFYDEAFGAANIEQQLYTTFDPFHKSRSESRRRHDDNLPQPAVTRRPWIESYSYSSVIYVKDMLLWLLIPVFALPRLVYVLVQQAYLYFFFSFPWLYFARVARALEDSDLRISDIRRMTIASTAQWNASFYDKERADHFVTPAMMAFRNAWHHLVDALIREWTTLCIVSALLLMAIVSLLQTNGAGADPVTRTLCLFSLICASASLGYGILYIVLFPSMRGMHKAAGWASEARRSSPPLLWNVWVLLAMPAVWFTWALVLFITAVMTFAWRTGFDAHTYHVPHAAALGTRIGLSCLLALAFMYLVLMVLTFIEYGEAMDQRWRERRLASEGTHILNKTSLQAVSALSRDATSRDATSPSAQQAISSTRASAQGPPHTGEKPIQEPVEESSHVVAADAEQFIIDPPVLPERSSFQRVFIPPEQPLPSFPTTKLLDLQSEASAVYDIPHVLEAERDVKPWDMRQFIPDVTEIWDGRPPLGSEDMVRYRENAPHLPGPSSEYPLSKLDLVFYVIQTWNRSFFQERGITAILCEEYPNEGGGTTSSNTESWSVKPRSRPPTQRSRGATSFTGGGTTHSVDEGAPSLVQDSPQWAVYLFDLPSARAYGVEGLISRFGPLAHGLSKVRIHDCIPPDARRVSSAEEAVIHARRLLSHASGVNYPGMSIGSGSIEAMLDDLLDARLEASSPMCSFDVVLRPQSVSVSQRPSSALPPRRSVSESLHRKSVKQRTASKHPPLPAPVSTQDLKVQSHDENR